MTPTVASGPGQFIHFAITHGIAHMGMAERGNSIGSNSSECCSVVGLNQTCHHCQHGISKFNGLCLLIPFCKNASFFFVRGSECCASIGPHRPQHSIFSMKTLGSKTSTTSTNHFASPFILPVVFSLAVWRFNSIVCRLCPKLCRPGFLLIFFCGRSVFRCFAFFVGRFPTQPAFVPFVFSCLVFSLLAKITRQD